MRVAKENRRNRDAPAGFRSGASWLCRARCGAWRRAGARAIARGLRGGAGRKWQRGRLRGNAGLPGEFRGGAIILAARRGCGAAWFSACAGVEGRDGAGRPARSGGTVACCGRCGALCRRGGGSDRIMAPAACARPDGESEAGACGGGFGRHSTVAADRGGTRAQRCADPLERQRGAFRGAGGASTGQASFHSRIVAPAGPPRWRMLASGMGS